MQGVCRLSRRWHQQFCHSPSFGPHWQCFQTCHPVRGLRQARRPSKLQRQTTTVDTIPFTNDHSVINDLHAFSPSRLLASEGDNLVVREFEQFGSDDSTRKQVEPNQELNDEVSEVWEELQDVQRQLEVARQGPFGRQSEFMKKLTIEERERLLKALAEEGISPQDEEESLDLAEIDRLMEEDKQEIKHEEDLAITLHIPKAHKALVSHFNKVLREAQSKANDTVKNLNLWKWYLRCQQNIPGFSRIVSETVWDFLWAAQSQLRVRPQHLVMLGKDMLAVNQPMSQKQSLEYIRALHNYNDPSEALKVWEETRPQLALDTTIDFLSEFYSSGIQLYTSVGRPQKAQSVAFAAIQKGVKAHILAHVISGWAQHKTAEGATKAWAIYLKMRTLIGDDMTPELYERISDALLTNNHNEMALAAFKDMIVGMQGSGEDTLKRYQEVLGDLRFGGDAEEIESAVNQVSLTMLLALPKQYHNKFFFASWIKKLLGQQRIEAASMVVDLMYERNIKPDAIHLNGIVGAWLRDGKPGSREKAVTLAWEMIQARVNHCSEREQNTSLREFGLAFRKVVPLSENNNIWLKPIRLERPVPPANVETFSLLFDYHEQRHQWHEYQRLTQTMIGPAQLRPNTFIMNKWLSAEVQSRSYDRFWALFNGLKKDIPPDVETFGLAWQVVAASVKTTKSMESTSHRRLFANMMDWVRFMKPYKRENAREEFNDKLYSDIVRSFCNQLDLQGTICAMQGLYKAFGATPDNVVVQLTTGQIARLLPRSDPSMPAVRGRRRVNAKFSQDQTTLKRIASIVETLEAQMKIEMVESGGATPAELEDEASPQAKKLRLDVLTEFLVLMMRKMAKETEDPVQSLKEVAQTMKVDISQVKMNVNLP